MNFLPIFSAIQGCSFLGLLASPVVLVLFVLVELWILVGILIESAGDVAGMEVVLLGSFAETTCATQVLLHPQMRWRLRGKHGGIPCWSSQWN